MTNFEKFKQALKKLEEERYEALKKEIKDLKAKIEHILALILECSSSQARADYAGLDMH